MKDRTQKIKNMLEQGHKPTAIAERFRMSEEEVLKVIEGPKVEVKKVVEAPKKEAVKPVQTTTQTQGYNATTGLHTKTTKKVGFGKK